MIASPSLGVRLSSATTHGTWSQLPITGAAQSAAYGVIYDPVNHRKLEFAGSTCSNQCFSHAVTALDLTTYAWTSLTPAGTPPPDRFLPQTIYDPVRRRMVIFGGSYTSDPDAWALSLPAGGATAWQKLITEAGPSCRYYAVAVYDELGDRMILIGGDDSQSHAPNNEVWALNFADDTWSLLVPAGTPPTPQYAGANGSGVYDRDHDRIVMVFGGQTWELGSLSTTPTWTQLAVSTIYSSGQAVLDSIANRMLYVQSGTQVLFLDLSGPPAWNPLTLDGQFPPDVQGPIFDPVGNRVIVERPGNPRFGIPHVTSALNLHLPVPTSVPPASAAAFGLTAPKPNPTSGNFACAFALSSSDPATLEVFDVTGRRVSSREVGSLGAGSHRVGLTIDGRLPAGVYTVALVQAGRRATARVVVMR